MFREIATDDHLDGAIRMCIRFPVRLCDRWRMGSAVRLCGALSAASEDFKDVAGDGESVLLRGRVYPALVRRIDLNGHAAALAH